MSELVEFIRGCLDADEQTARACLSRVPEFRKGVRGGHWSSVDPDEGTPRAGRFGQVATVGMTVTAWPDHAAHIVRHDPARVLAEVNAKRAILDKYERASVAFEQSVNPATSAAVMALAEVVDEMAQPFRGQPGWRDEWGTQWATTTKRGTA